MHKSTAESVQAEIARRKALFAAADDAGKRVLIAQDVIAQVNRGRFTAKTGDWMVPLPANPEKYATKVQQRHDLEILNDPDHWDYNEIRSGVAVEYATNESKCDESLQLALLGGEIENCQCCALGSMFLSCTLFNNQAKVSETMTGLGIAILEDRVFSNGLNTIFSDDQLALIEAAFEGGGGHILRALAPRFDEDLELFSKLERFVNNCEDPKDRLIAIMQNIIHNGGEFKP